VPYFNTGNCLSPGTLTGLEIEKGWITPIEWRARFGRSGRDLLSVERHLRGIPRKLASFG
jgi:hypothetical protein